MGDISFPIQPTYRGNCCTLPCILVLVAAFPRHPGRSSTTAAPGSWRYPRRGNVDPLHDSLEGRSLR